MNQRRNRGQRVSGLTIAAFLSFLMVMPILAFSQGGVSTPSVPVTTAPPTPPPAPPPPATPVLFNQMTIMPYITGSLNLFSGLAFPEPASGAGIGGGLSFDMTREGQKSGFMFDFAFQDMSGFAANGMCIQSITDAKDTVFPAADAYHYWYYLLFEPYLKLQGGARNGYFIIGASIGMAVLGETVAKGETITQFLDWDNSPYGNRFRFDLRAGLGVELAKIGKHVLVLEARAGYPLTNVISAFPNACTGGVLGNWRIITMQANLGLRI
jgi:hypothetical protein